MGFEQVFDALLLLFSVLYGGIILWFTLGLIKAGRSHIKYDVAGVSTIVRQSVSVVIPVRNEAADIERILEELRVQHFPVTILEIIVTDDFSDDDTLKRASGFASRYPQFPLVLIFPNGLDGSCPGKKSAIERAVQIAKGEIILCTDADTTRHPRWISSMAGCFASLQTQMVLGPVVLTHEISLLQRIQALEFLGIMGTTAGSAGQGFPVMCNGANLAYRRSAFIVTGGYAGNIRFRSGDDQFLMNSVIRKFSRKAILFNHDPEAIVRTEPEATLIGFLNQRIRWVSKSRGYRDPVVIGVGLVTWGVHCLLLLGILLGIAFPSILGLSLLLWVGKMVADLPPVWLMSRFFGEKRLLRYYFPAQVFQLVYVATVGLAGLLLPYRWKGRKGNR